MLLGSCTLAIELGLFDISWPRLLRLRVTFSTVGTPDCPEVLKPENAPAKAAGDGARNSCSLSYGVTSHAPLKPSEGGAWGWSLHA